MRVSALKKISAVMLAAACAAVLSGCLDVSSLGSRTVYGKVTAVNGNKITLALGTVDDIVLTSGGRLSDGSESQSESSSSSSGSNDSSSSSSQGKSAKTNGGKGIAQSAGSDDAFKPNGKTESFTIDDTSVIKQGIFKLPDGEQSSDASDGTSEDASGASLGGITAGTILQATYNIFGKVKSVIIIGSSSSSAQSETQSASSSSD